MQQRESVVNEVILKILHTSQCISLQRHVISLNGPVVTASGFKDRLAVVTHVSECLSSNDQVGSVFMVAIASEISRSTMFSSIWDYGFPLILELFTVAM